MNLRSVSAFCRIVTPCLALCAGIATTTVAAERSNSAVTVDAKTGIIIAPRIFPAVTKNVPVVTEKVTVQVDEQEEAAADEGLPVIVPAPEKTSKYREIFKSIPFSRAEFDANPNYRHDATMEILTGNPRPEKSIIQAPPAPAAPPNDLYLPNLPVMRHYFDMSRGPYSRYQHLFGYQGGYRPKYYHY